MVHALTLYEAVAIYAKGHATFEQCMEIVPEMAAEWDAKCCHVEERLRFLARHAGRRCPV